MTFLKRSLSLALATSLLVACGTDNPGAGPGSARTDDGNPLATADQRELDAAAIALYDSNRFEPLRSEAKAAYVAARQQIPSTEALSRLDLAIDELVFSAIQKIINGDPYRPKLYWVNAQPRQWFGLDVPGSRYSYDNPDNIYRIGPVSGDLRYELRGRRYTPGPSDVTFSLINNPSSQGTEAFLDGRELVVGPDGRYVITIDNQPANGRRNHLQSNRDVVQLFIRNNLGHWNTETPDALELVRVDDSPAPAPRQQAAIVADAYRSVQEGIVFYGIGALAVKTHANAVNTLPQPQQSATLGTLVSQANSFGHFRLAEDEAWVITLKRGGAGYFVVPITDPWMITVDPAKHQSSLNQAQSVANTDGSYTFVVSANDPGVANWLDTAGLREGTVMVRWQGLPATPLDGGPGVSAEVVKLADLTRRYPGLAGITPTQRDAALSARQQGYLRRIATP